MSYQGSFPKYVAKFNCKYVQDRKGDNKHSTVMHLPVTFDHKSILEEIYRVFHVFAKQYKNEKQILDTLSSKFTVYKIHVGLWEVIQRIFFSGEYNFEHKLLWLYLKISITLTPAEMC